MLYLISSSISLSVEHFFQYSTEIFNDVKIYVDAVTMDDEHGSMSWMYGNDWRNRFIVFIKDCVWNTAKGCYPGPSSLSASHSSIPPHWKLNLLIFLSKDYLMSKCFIGILKSFSFGLTC